MFDTLFPNLKQAAFWFLLLAVAIAGLFGYADWTPTPEQSDLLNAIVEFVKAALLLYGSLYVGARVERSRQ